MAEPSSPSGATVRRPLRIFLCHASGDKPAVRDLYRRLREDGFRPWLDEEDLLPGQDWQREIPLGVKNSDIVIVCLSRQSVTKTGYVQKEIKFALDVADEQPEGTIFLIPLRLEECDVPQRLSRWHWVDLFEATGYERLARALDARAKSVRRDTPPVSEDPPPDIASIDAALLRLRKKTSMLYNAIVDSLRSKVAIGQAEIRNGTLRAIQPDLEELRAWGLLRYYLASSDLSVETTNRVDFQIMKASPLDLAVKRIASSGECVGGDERQRAVSFKNRQSFLQVA